MKKLLRVSGSVALVFALAACGGGEGGPDAPALEGPGAAGAGGANGGGVAIGPDGLPVGPDGKPLPTKLDGRYEISNSLDLTSAGVLPDMANDTLQALSNFREKPTETMVALLEAAKVPVVAQVLGVIPAIIRDQVLGFVDDHVFSALYQAVPVTKQITGMLDDLASIATKFEVVSLLALPPGNAVGDANAKHQITGVAYRWMDKRTVIQAPQVLANLEIENVKINAVGLDKRTPDLESARLALGDHTFTVPIGSFTVLAADMLVKDKFGAKDLRDAVGRVVNCVEVAKDVASRCVGLGLAKVCVGHQSEIQGLCNAGLDIIVSTLEARIKALDIPALHLKSGTAKMWDAPADKGPLDAVVDRIDNGYWSAGVGKDDHPILATFVGRRVGDFGVPSATH